MDALLKSAPAIIQLGLGGVALLILGLIVWRMFKIIEDKDAVFLDVVQQFRQDIQDGNASREKDADQVTKAIDHLSDIVKLYRGQ